MAAKRQGKRATDDAWSEPGSGVRAALGERKRAVIPRKRRHTRYQVDLPLMFIDEDGVSTQARCTSLSLGGMFIVTDHLLPPGGPLRIQLRLPEATLLLPASVRWKSDNGLGVQHSLLGARDTFVLTEYLAIQGVASCSGLER
jgi:hypothetical protein